MSKVGTWSTTAGNNNSAPPDGWPEGQAPSTVNDCARENMAAIRTCWQTAQFFDHAFTPTFVNANVFTVPGNQTAYVENSQRLKLFDGANILYRNVETVSGSAVSTTITMDSGTAITSALSSFAISIISNTNGGIPRKVSLSSITAESVFFGNTDGDTGFVWIVDGSIKFQSNATEIFRIGTAVGILTVIMNNTANVRIEAAHGSAAAPSIFFDASDTDTGFYWVQDGMIYVSCNASQHLRIGTDGLHSDAFLVTSDAATKTDWADFPSDFVTQLSGIKAGSFTKLKDGTRQIGVPAQELQQLIPEAILSDEKGTLVANYGPTAMVAVVELAKRCEELQARIVELEKKP